MVTNFFKKMKKFITTNTSFRGSDNSIYNKPKSAPNNQIMKKRVPPLFLNRKLFDSLYID